MSNLALAVRKKNKVFVLSGPCYSVVGKKLARVVDNGNGYTGKFYSWRSSDPDVYINLDYADAEYLYLALGEFLRGD